MGDKQPLNAKEKQVIHQQSYISDDFIIHEILTRLPVKSILRFKSVSKSWYSTLSSSKFATYHLMRFPLFHPSAPVNTLFIESDNNFYLFPYDDEEIPCNVEANLFKIEVDIDVEDNRLYLTGCCNGLVCLSRPYGEYFVLWNPATRKMHKYVSDGYLKDFDGKCFSYIAHGFGYASSDDDYKYVRLRIMTVGLGSRQGRNIFHIFSLKKNKWRKIDFNYDLFYPYGKPMLLNEKLYWVSLIERVGSVIVCFDLGLEKFDIIKLNLLIDEGFAYLVAMGERLSEFKYDSTTYSRDELKLIQIHGSSITIEKSVDLSKEMILEAESQMIGYTRTGSFFVTGESEDVVEERPLCRKTLWLVDPGIKPMQCKTLLKGHNPINIAKYVPSLVSPFPIEESSKA